MPRYTKTRTVADRLATPESYRLRRVWQWTDPFPEIHGTQPEKMVYARLSLMGIPFLFLNDVNINLPDLEFNKDFQADFVIPDLKLIIEIQGAYFHSMPKNIEQDAYKFALYEAAGYRALAWWDYDIFLRLDDLIAAEPQLARVMHANTRRSSELSVVKRTKIDTSQGIRTLNRKRAGRHGIKPVTGRRQIRKASASYGTR